MEYLYPINAIHSDGKTVVLLYDFDAVIRFRVGKKSIGEYRQNAIYNWRERRYVYSINDWILRDDRGRVVKIDDFKPNYTSRWYGNRHKRIRQAMANNLPIPYTGKRKWHRHNAPYKKNGGNGIRARADSRARYEEKEYGVPFKRLKFDDSWGWD